MTETPEEFPKHTYRKCSRCLRTLKTRAKCEEHIMNKHKGKGVCVSVLEGLTEKDWLAEQCS